MALSREQKQARRIGGSSSAAVMGLSKYKRPEELRREMVYSMHGRDAINWTEDVDKEVARLESDLDNIHIRVGTFLEDFIRDRLKNMGYSVRKKNQGMVHPDYDFITMNIDGRESDTVEEIKAISVYRQKEFGDEWTDQIPMDYACQTHHYTLFPQFKKARLRALFLSDSEKELIDRMIRGMILKNAPEMTEEQESIEIEVPRYGKLEWNFEKQESYKADPICSMNLDIVRNIVDIAPLKTYEIIPDPVTHAKMLEEYKDFWHRVKMNIPCIPKTLEDCQIIFDGYNSQKSIITTDEISALAAERKILKARMKADEAREKEINAACMIFAGEHDIVLGSDGKKLFSLGQSFSRTKDEAVLRELVEDISGYETPVIDWKKVEAEIPEIYQKCRTKYARSITWPRK